MSDDKFAKGKKIPGMERRVNSGEESFFSCTECEKAFKGRTGLKLHLRTHSLRGKRTVCEKALADSYRKDLHRKTGTPDKNHTEEKQFRDQASNHREESEPKAWTTEKRFAAGKPFCDRKTHAKEKNHTAEKPSKEAAPFNRPGPGESDLKEKPSCRKTSNSSGPEATRPESDP